MKVCVFYLCVITIYFRDSKLTVNQYYIRTKGPHNAIRLWDLPTCNQSTDREFRGSPTRKLTIAIYIMYQQRNVTQHRLQIRKLTSIKMCSLPVGKRSSQILQTITIYDYYSLGLYIEKFYPETLLHVLSRQKIVHSIRSVMF